jgi:predicted house-cleaning noncanonical NTP pyrophosphatase (MazG superfamily)
MPTFKYAKLVRDNIWGWHEESGHQVQGEVLTGPFLRRQLCEKLREEADEVIAALTRKEFIEELADVRQVLDDLCAAENISQEDVLAVQAEKFARKGGFQGGRYIATVTIPDEDDEWAQYCRKSPEKYPEVEDE